MDRLTQVTAGGQLRAATGGAGVEGTREALHVDAVWLGAGALVVAALVALWLGGGVGGLDIARYLGYELFVVALPGLLLAALLRRGRIGMPHVCLAIPLGLAQVMLLFVLLAAVGLRDAAPLAPLASFMVCVALLTNANRLRWRNVAISFRPGLRWDAALLAAIAVISVGLMDAREFRLNPLPSQIRTGATYSSSDLLWHIGNAASLKEFWPPRDLRAVGEPLRYYIGDYVQIANNAMATHLDIATILLRLDPLMFLGALAFQLFWLGRVIGSRARTGLVAAFLFLLAGDVSVLRGSPWSYFGNGVLTDMYSSPTYLLALLFFVPVLVLSAEWLSAGAPVRSRTAVALLLLIVAAGFTKSATLVVLLAAGGAMFVIEAIAMRRFPRGAAALSAAAGGTFILLAPLIYWHGSSASIRLKPLETLRHTVAWTKFSGLGPGFVPPTVLKTLLVLLGYAPALLLGIVLLATLRRRITSAEAWLASVATAGLGFVLLFAAVGDSQQYFWHYGYVALAAVAALGIEAALARRQRVRIPALAAVIGVTLIGVGSTILQAGPIADRWAAKIMPGLPRPTYPPIVTRYEITRSVLDGLLWLRSHSDPRAVIMVNNQSNLAQHGDDRYFYYSAFAQRQIMLEGWEYTPRLTIDPTQAEKHELDERLALERQVYEQGSTAAIKEVRRLYDVSYILVDERDSFPRHPLPSSAVRQVYRGREVTIYAVRS